MKKFYLHLNNTQEGPFDVEDLRQKNITFHTPVWYPGLKEWINAGEVEELAGILRVQTAPPFPHESPTDYSAPAGRRKGFTTWGRFLRFAVGAGLLIWVIIAIHDYMYPPFYENRNSNESYVQKVMTVEEIEKADPLRFLEASLTYRPTVFGRKFALEVDVRNAATVAYYKDVVMRVNYLSRTGSAILSENHTLYDYFAPHSNKRFEFKINRPKGCETISFNLVGAVPH